MNNKTNNISNMNHYERLIYFNHRKKINNIKRIGLTIGAGVLAIVFFIGLLCTENLIKSTYTREALVIYRSGDNTTVVTLDGNEWDFIDDSFNEGDEVRLTFDTNNTDDNIYDDIIIKATKITR